MQHINPSVDDKNPFYCPAIPAAAYLKSLQSRARLKPDRRRPLSHFARLLGQSFNDNRRSDSNAGTIMGSDWILGGYGHGWFSSQSHAEEDLPAYSPTVSGRAQAQFERRSEQTFGRQQDLKRKSSFSDFGAPPKYARSVESLHASSFDIEVRHEKLQYNQVDSSPQRTNEILRGLDLLDDNIGTLTTRLDAALPGIRLKERLSQLDHRNPQAWMDYIAENGYINERVLDIFSRTSIKRIIFAPSMFNENGLNLFGSNMYAVFRKQDSFRSLYELSFAGIKIRDSDLQHIQHLPNLSVLNLTEAGIGNEGVFLLVSLKGTLKRLCLAGNPDIDDDAVPAILLLSELSFLSILDTGIKMPGLRRLAQIMQHGDRIMDIEIPFACEVYVDNIHSQYLYNLTSPLVKNAYACSKLSSSDLKRNLEAHAYCNPSIVASGTRPEMLQRLSDILKTRKLDMLVVSMLEGNNSFSENK